MKELKDINGGTIGQFFTLHADLAADTPIALFAANSGAIVGGFTGKIVSIEYREIEGARTPALKEDQVITVGPEGAKEQVILQRAGDGRKAVAPTIIFDNGRTMTLGLLTQGQGKSSIHFKGEAAPTPVINLTKGLLEKMIGRNLKCENFYKDPTNMITRNAGTPEFRSYAANVYEFVEL